MHQLLILLIPFLGFVYSSLQILFTRVPTFPVEPSTLINISSLLVPGGGGRTQVIVTSGQLRTVGGTHIARGWALLPYLSQHRLAVAKGRQLTFFTPLPHWTALCL